MPESKVEAIFLSSNVTVRIIAKKKNSVKVNWMHPNDFLTSLVAKQARLTTRNLWGTVHPLYIEILIYKMCTRTILNKVPRTILKARIGSCIYIEVPSLQPSTCRNSLLDLYVSSTCIRIHVIE